MLASTHTHTHTHTQRERERERESHVIAQTYVGPGYTERRKGSAG
jgi:hypothetical protein